MEPFTTGFSEISYGLTFLIIHYLHLEIAGSPSIWNLGAEERYGILLLVKVLGYRSIHNLTSQMKKMPTKAPVKRSLMGIVNLPYVGVICRIKVLLPFGTTRRV